jgi:hypothetical protein
MKTLQRFSGNIDGPTLEAMLATPDRVVPVLVVSAVSVQKFAPGGQVLGSKLEC